MRTHALWICALFATSSAAADEPAPAKPIPQQPTTIAPRTPGKGAPAKPRGARDPGGDLLAIEPPEDRPKRPPPPPAKPAPEIVAHAKKVAGAWTCKGTSTRSDGSSASVQGRVVSRLDLDNAWIVTTFRETNGPLKWTEYRTYDGTAKQWTKIQLVNTSGHVVSTATEVGGELVWSGTAKSPHGSIALKDHEKLEGKQLSLWGEAQIGGAWQKLYQVTCKR